MVDVFSHASGSSSSAPITIAQADSSSSERVLKRKFEDAIHVLDEAVGSTTNSEPVPPSKKPRPSRSLYATLAKYGIKKETKSVPESRLDSLSKNAPHLVAILSRTASRAKQKVNPFRNGHTPSTSISTGSSPVSEYRPSSTTSFLSRLATYKLTTYANKPQAIDAVAASKCGWVNDGKDRLVCGICSVSWVVANKDGLNRDAANALVEKQRVQLVEMHKHGCPWKTGQCDASIYRVPLQTPAAMAREVKIRAAKLDLVMTDVQIKHPLNSTQIQALHSIISSVKLHESTRLSDNEPSVESHLAPSISSAPASASAPAPLLVTEPSTTAIITALFGWSIMLPSTTHDKPPRSISRATSVAALTPSRSQTPFGSILSSRASTPQPSTSRLSASANETASPGISAITSVKPDATLLFCSLCQRRVGLWAFLPSTNTNGTLTPLPSGPSLAGETSSQPRRQLDVLKEHRSYCPYVVRSTTLPLLPVIPSSSSTPSSSAPRVSLSSTPSLAQLNGQPEEIEGWRAVMSVILRYGAAQKQRLGLARRAERSSADGVSHGGDALETIEETDPVAAMVEGVKTRGGRDLLKYVKGLLG